MDVETTKECLCINRIIGRSEETVIVEGDLIVPDIKPDILNSINTVGNVCIYKRELLEGKVRLDGNINVCIMYLADSENETVRGLTGTIDFAQILDLENCNRDMNLDDTVSIKSIECKILNGRKVNVKAILEIKLSVYAKEEIELVRQINNVDAVETLKNRLQLNSLVGSGETRLSAKDTIMLDEGSQIVEILSSSVEICNKEYKISYNKVLTKAEMVVHIMYLTSDNTIKHVESKISAVGFIDIPNVSEDNICDVNYKVKSMIIKPNTNMENSVMVDAEILAKCDAYENKDMEIMQDLYSASQELQYTSKQVNALTSKKNIFDKCSIEEKIGIPEIGENEIYDVMVKPTITNKNVVNNKVIYQGEVDLLFIFKANNISNIDTKAYKAGFDFSVEIPGINSNYEVQEEFEIISQDFIVGTSGSIEMKLVLGFNISTYKVERINVIDNVRVCNDDDDRKKYSMVIYFVKPGDTLWKIAKRFRSTIEDIARVNGIEDIDKLSVGQQLFIPKYVKRGEIYG